jgi:hypothetical protein
MSGAAAEPTNAPGPGGFAAFAGAVGAGFLNIATTAGGMTILFAKCIARSITF